MLIKITENYGGLAKTRVLNLDNEQSHTYLLNLIKNQKLSDHSDIHIVNPINGQALVYSGNTWINSNISTSSGISYLYELNDVSIVAPTDGEILLYSGGTWINAASGSMSGISYLSNLLDVHVTSAQTNDILSYQGGFWVNWTGLTNYYTKLESNSNFLSANTSFYTQLYINTNFYTSAQTYTKGEVDALLTGVTVTLSGYYTSAYTNQYFSRTGHTHTFSDITDSGVTLANYSLTSHTHAQYLTGFTELDPVWEAAKVYYYTSSQTDSLFLNYYTSAHTNQYFSRTGHTHLFSSITDSATTLSNYSLTSHTHAQYLTGFTELDPVWMSEKAYYYTTGYSNDYFLHCSAGVYVLPTITNNSGITVTLGAGEYVVFSDTYFTKPSIKYSHSGDTLNMVDNSINYIIFDGSTQTISSSTNRDNINQSSIIPIYSIYREGTEFHLLNWDTMAKGLSNKISDRLVRTERFAVETGGLMISTSGLTCNCTAGVVWYGAVNTVLSACTSASDECELWYHTSAGTWTKSAITLLDNLHYDDGTGLQTLGPAARYSVNWVFRGIELNKHLFVVLGTQDYKLSEAQSSTIPLLPSIISTQCILIGRVIIAKNASVATETASAFDVPFNRTPITEHNTLSAIDGGDVSGYWHLTLSQYQNLSGLTANSYTLLSIFNNYTGVTAVSSFLSANTSFYTQAQANSNFLSASTDISSLSGVSLSVFNNYTGVTVPDTYATIVNLNAHTGNTSNPHNVTAAQLSALTNVSYLSAISGTTGYLSVFNSSSGLTNSTIFQSGNNVGIGINTPSYNLDINGTLRVASLEGMGGVITRSGGYTIHTFTITGSTEQFIPPSNVTVNYLVVGGGGGGSSSAGGGGGGFQTGTTTVNGGTPYAITIGSGGTASNNGGNSIFSTITALGGGAGGEYSGNIAGKGKDGGCGGGEGWPSMGVGVGSQGYNGGTANVARSGFGGGGGAGSVGGNAGTNSGGNGGSGKVSSISGGIVTYAGGGGGGGFVTRGIGVNGGGHGAQYNTLFATNGTDGLGGGGGGAYPAGIVTTPARGGSGIVIISYITPTTSIATDGSGNVGIGLVSPTSKLHIDAGTATASALKFTANATTGQLTTDGFDVGISTTGQAEIRQRENLDLVLYTNNIERIRVNSATTKVSGTLSAVTYYGNGTNLINSNISGTTNYITMFNSNSSITNSTIFQSGNTIGINTSQPNTNYNLDIAGTFKLGLLDGSGGIITHVGLYTIHTFTGGTASFIPSGNYTIEYLVVAGGGGGGSSQAGDYAGGGGGAGGYISGVTNVIANSAYTISVGSGGTQNINGADSTFGIVTATGGGRGFYTGNYIGGSGGSAGGWLTGQGTNIAGQGNAAGRGDVAVGTGGGGGGAGSAGSLRIGGSGLSNSINGTAVTYAIGGNGGFYNSSGNGGAGAVNTGNGGGGAACNNSVGYAGGTGGSGVVIIKYLTPLTTWATDTMGYVGFGFGTPAAKLHVDLGNGYASSLKFTAGNVTGQLATDGVDFGIDTLGNAEIRQRENLNTILYVNNTEIIRINTALTSIQGNTWTNILTATTINANYLTVSTIGTEATGGIITRSGGYTYHTFTGSSTFNSTNNLSIEYLIVAGGGGGGSSTANGYGGGGGGAGGYISGITILSTSGYIIIVGSGGTTNVNGANSTFNGLIAIGGARGANDTTQLTGGVGGSAGGYITTIGTATPGQGNVGGDADSGSGGGGGGGGASGVGNNGVGQAGGSGGVGKLWLNGITYAIGGGGGSFGIPGNGTDGTPNTGNGAKGANCHPSFGYIGGTGGSGIVIIRYITPISSLSVNSTGTQINSILTVNNSFGSDVAVFSGKSGSTTIESDGTLRFDGNATVFDDFVASLSIQAAGAAAPDIVNYTITGVSCSFYSFDGAATEERLSSMIEMYHSYKTGSTVEIHTHCMPSSNNSGNLVWYFDYFISKINSPPIYGGTLSAITAISANTQYFDYTVSVGEITYSNLNIGDFIIGTLRRTPTGLDTYPDDVLLKQVAAHCEIDTVGSRMRYTK